MGAYAFVTWYADSKAWNALFRHISYGRDQNIVEFALELMSIYG